MSQRAEVARKVAAVRNNYQMFGLLQTMKDGLLYWLDQRSDDFDRKYGVQTAQWMEVRDAQIEDSAARASAIRYVPTPEPVLRHVLSSVLRSRAAETFSFVDLGCGQGRALLIASQFPFARVVGVEISPLHAQIARDNVRRYLAHPRARRGQRSQIEVCCANAADFEFPDSNLLIYLYRPFVGPVFSAVAEQLSQFCRHTGREVLVAYSCPQEEHMFAERNDFVKVDEFRVILSEYSWSLWRCTHSEARRAPASSRGSSASSSSSASTSAASGQQRPRREAVES